MNRRGVLTLAAAFVVLMAVLLITELASDKGQAPDEPLFALMRDDINAVNTITVTAAGDEVVATLSREGELWGVAERDGYPADTGKLRQLLLGLADARLVEAKTSNPKYYSRLGVEDVSAEEAGGVLVQVATESSQYAVIIGDQTRGDYRYIRRGGEAGSWLIDKNPEAPSETVGWLNASIIDIDAALVHSVTIEHPDGETIKLTKTNAEQTDFAVTEIPAGRELSYATVANAVGGVLDNLSLDDVGPVAAPGPEAVTTTFETFDGRVVRVSSEEIDSQYWIQVSASYDAELAAHLGLPQEDLPADAPGDSGGASATDSDEKVSTTVAALNRRTEHWRYQIPQYKFEQLTRRWQDLLKDVE